MGCYTNDISRSQPATSADTKEEGTNTPCPTYTGARAICGGNYTLSTTNKRYQAWYCPQKNG